MALLRRQPASADRALLAQHWDRLYRAMYLVSRDASEAEDLTQEALTKALESFGRFDHERPLAPWLNRIASNTAKDWLRRRTRVDFLPLADEPTDDADSIANQVADAVLPDDLAEALARLDPGSRLIVVLRHLFEMNATEIASLLDIEASTVRTRLRRALLQMREDLEPKEAANGNQVR